MPSFIPPHRQLPRLNGLVGGTVAAAALLSLATPVAAAADEPSAGSSGSPGSSGSAGSVSYGGWKLAVPDGWQVVDLERSPEECLRLDRAALYLGRVGDQARCTGGAVGERTGTVHLEPLAGAAQRADIPTVVVSSGTELPQERPDAPSGEIRYALEELGLMATVSYADDATVAEGVLESATRDSSNKRRKRAAPAPAPAPYTPPKPPTSQVVPGAYQGEGFDACQAPSAPQMKAWRKASPYRAVGVYIGGSARACAQPQLTAEWIRQQAADGWHLMPIWVGPQPWHRAVNPANRLIKDEAGAARQGREAANGAAQAAKGLGLGPGAALYNDVENYDVKDRNVFDGPVRAYLSAWTERLHELGYRSGAYVNASSGVRALKSEFAKGRYTMPDVIWTANWNGKADVSDASMGLDRGQWDGQRAHQYKGTDENNKPLKETHGGVTIHVDRNYLDVRGPQKAPTEPKPAAGPQPKPAAGPEPKPKPKPRLFDDVTDLVTSADFNGDGRTDIAAVRKDGSLHAFYAKKDGTLEYGRALWHDKTWGGMRRIVGGDFNGDGIGDVIGLQRDGRLRGYTGTREGHVQARGRIWPDNSWKNVRTFAAMRDDRSGRDGLVAIARDGGLYFYPTRADGTLAAFSERRTLWHDTSWKRMKHLVAGDFDLPLVGNMLLKTRHTDLAGIHQDGSFRLYPGSGPGELERTHRPLWKDTSWGSRKALLGGDFNGDGRADVVGIRGDGVPQFYAGAGNGRLADGKRMD
ncbi:glycoside hydrolase domain-containing protein [Streptomyces sp. NPDC001339]|uniref:glycoside hydrolase domain-containing protein n=1 Tax=Streptomyces sp. NPDC001339 TaxID=3364563 RepID=UPI0036C6E0A0